MAVSFAFISILIMLDVTFIAVFWTLRNLRRLTDLESYSVRQKAAPQDENGEGGNIFESRRPYRASPDGEEKEPVFEQFLRKASVFWQRFSEQCRMTYQVVFGCVMGYIPMTSNVSEKFPEWEPLPYRVGIAATCLLLVLSMALLTPNVVLGAITAPKLCSLNFESEKWQQQIEDATNLEAARKQYQYTTRFREALLNDTTLYGTDGYECEDIENSNGESFSGKKDEWPNSTYGPFFPGYCEEALDAALYASKTTQCTKTVCGCNFMVCIGGITEVCVETPYVCDQHSNDQVNELKDYRLEQQRRASATFSGLQVDVSKYAGTVARVRDFAEEIATKVYRQVDIAGSAYMAYSCAALFFPSPLQLFRTPIAIQMKQTLFGVQKHVFILLVLAIWWGVEYFHQIRFFTPSIQLYVKQLQMNPCYADPRFFRDRRYTLESICQELVIMESEFQLSNITITNVAAEVYHFVNSCECSFPLDSLTSFVSPDNVTQEEAAAFGFVETVDSMCTGCDDDQSIFVPSKNFSFLGNTTMCRDSNFAESHVFQNLNDGGLTTSDAWIKSGVLAHLVIKFVVSNFCLNMLRVVDPFTDCGGKFEQPPYLKLDPLSMLHVQQTKATILSRIAIIRAFFWGLMMQWCILSLAYGIFLDVKSSSLNLQREDLVVGAFFLALVPIIIGVFLRVNRIIKKKIDEAQGVFEDDFREKLRESIL